MVKFSNKIVVILEKEQKAAIERDAWVCLVKAFSKVCVGEAMT